MDRPFLTRAGGAVPVGAQLWFCAVAMAQPCNPPEVRRFSVPSGGTSPSQVRVSFTGTTVAISDSSVSSELGEGVVHVSRRYPTGTWGGHLLYPHHGVAFVGFGKSVSAYGDSILVGGEDGATLFTKHGDRWDIEQDFPTVYTPFPIESIGDVRLFGDMVLIHQRLHDGPVPDIGQVHVFRRCHGWAYSQKIELVSGTTGDEFGRVIITDGQSLFVGSPGNHTSFINDRGAVYRYEDDGTKFVPKQTLTPPEPSAGAAFGTSIAYDGDLLAIGAPGFAGVFSTPMPGAGAVILYVPYMGQWVRRHTIYEPNPTPGSNFGKLIALDDGWLTVATNTGAYAFRVDDPSNPGPPADLQTADNSPPVVDLAAHGTTVLVAREEAAEAVLYDVSLAGLDCNANGIPDHVEITSGSGIDCQGNCILDECELASGASSDCNMNNIPDDCEPDCNDSGKPDSCDVADGDSPDCDGNGVPDECQDDDCDGNGMPDACQLAQGLTPDCDSNGMVDECQDDDCDLDGVPDSCQLAMGALFDCDENGAIDRCETRLGEVAQPPALVERDLDFGAAIDANGEQLVVGAESWHASDAPPGAAIVYRRSGAEWTLDTILDAPALGPDVSFPHFGRSVATDGSVIVVGAYRAAVVYRHSGDAWAFEAVLLPDHYEGHSNYFGAAVDVDGDLIVVGDALGHPTTAWGAGAVSVFRHADGAWTPEHVFFGPRPGGYGWKVQLQGQRFVTTSYDAIFGAFLVVRRGDEWQVEAELPGPDPRPHAWAAGLDGDTLAVATYDNDAGAFIYRFDGLNWSPLAAFPNPGVAGMDGTGLCLAAGRLYVETEAWEHQRHYRKARVFAEENGSWHLSREFRLPRGWGATAIAPSGTLGVYSDQSTNTVTLIDPLSPRCGCPAGVVEFLDPPPGVVDARQAHPADGSAATYGIDSVLVLAPEGSVECWSVCDTAVSPMDQLRISQIERLGGDQYLIKLARPMTPGMQARITYTDLYDDRTTAEFTFRPGDVNADGATTPADVMTLINVLNGQQSAPWGVLSTDIDRSGTTDYADVARLIEIVQQGSQSGPSGTAGVHYRRCP